MRRKRTCSDYGRVRRAELVDSHKQAAGGAPALAHGGRAPSKRSVECAAGAENLAAQLLGLKQRAINEEAAHTGAKQLRNLRHDIDGLRGVQP